MQTPELFIVLSCKNLTVKISEAAFVENKSSFIIITYCHRGRKQNFFSDTETLFQIILLSLGAGKLPFSSQKYCLDTERDQPLGLYNISTGPWQLQQCLRHGSASVPTLDQTEATLSLPQPTGGGRRGTRVNIKVASNVSQYTFQVQTQAQ